MSNSLLTLLGLIVLAGLALLASAGGDVSAHTVGPLPAVIAPAPAPAAAPAPRLEFPAPRPAVARTTPARAGGVLTVDAKGGYIE